MEDGCFHGAGSFTGEHARAGLFRSDPDQIALARVLVLGEIGGRGEGSVPAPDCWIKFMKWCDRHSGGAFLFRGQGDGSPIIPKIARKDYHYSRARERQLLNAFKFRARPFLSMPVTSDWEWIALAQHHGAPTRLIDWSTSPLVAAWFAITSYPLTTDAVLFALEAERADIRSVDAMTGQASDGSILPGPLNVTRGVFLMETAPISSRITTQRGLFTLHSVPEAPLPIATGRQFPIPAAQRVQFQRKLFEFGVDASHIFPDLDGLCKSLDWRMRSSTRIGTVT